MIARSFLVLHGWQGSGPDHWQSWLVDRLRSRREHVVYPDLPERDHPQLEAWLIALQDSIATIPRERELVVICHSLAVLLWLHHEARGGSGASRVLLVAPPCASCGIHELGSFFEVPTRGDAHRSGMPRLLVASDNDPYCPGSDPTAEYAERFEIPSIVLLGAGHINVDAGYGPWPEVEEWALSGVWPQLH